MDGPTIAEFTGTPIVPTDDQRADFRAELARLINRYSRENGSDTPDFILAEYLEGCLDNFDAVMRRREAWYGRGRAFSSPAPDGEG